MNDHDIEPRALDRGAIMLWRKARREHLIAERLSMPADERRRHVEAIGRHLTDALGTVQGRTVGVYWPFRGEPSLRSWMEQIHVQGAQAAGDRRRFLHIGYHHDPSAAARRPHAVHRH